MKRLFKGEAYRHTGCGIKGEASRQCWLGYRFCTKNESNDIGISWRYWLWEEFGGWGVCWFGCGVN
ncbi:MAG: hypothetical protein LBJ00_17655 [Planctomycetaceae bacterium]|nr:hypothetical protein [Planctomycetaceae bacterium]